MITVRPSQLAELLSRTIAARLPVLVVGAPGVGKTDIVRAAARAAGADLIVSHPVVSDPTDARGLPWPDKGGATARFLPFGDLAVAIEAAAPTVWFLDDLGQAPPAVQAAFMQLILSRRVGEHRVSHHVTFVAATNRREDRAGVSGILEPVKSRFATIVHLEPAVDDWVAWALERDVPPELIAFIRTRPDLLHDFKPTTDMTNHPCPRTWARVAELMRLGLPQELALPAYAGAVGEGAATELMSFLRIVDQLPPIDAVLTDPRGIELPSDPSVLYALVAALAHKGAEEVRRRGNGRTDGIVGRIVDFAERLAAEGRGEFAGALVQDLLRREPSVATTRAWMAAANGDGAVASILNG